MFLHAPFGGSKSNYFKQTKCVKKTTIFSFSFLIYF